MKCRQTGVWAMDGVPLTRSSPANGGDPYVVVSTDTHAGPSLERQLRPYCAQKFLPQFDEFARSTNDPDWIALHSELRGAGVGSGGRQRLAVEAMDRTRACEGQQDPHARLADMDSEGIAAQVVFAGGQNGELLPFLGFGFDAGIDGLDVQLRAEGARIWNRWIADLVSVDPVRTVGVMQIPIEDVSEAVREIHRCREAGLRAVNFPAPRRDFLPYNEPVYEPLWAACEELDLPLLSHSGGGEIPMGINGPGGNGLFMAEVLWFSRRAIWQLIFSGVFERHPGLKLVLTEQRTTWVPQTLRDLDSIYLSQIRTANDLPKRPSEYWASNCFLSGSFLAPFEAAERYAVGLKNLMWGSDYPHAEGTWPRTSSALRFTFAGIPENEVRLILGENAIGVFDLDGAALRSVADRIGPLPNEVNTPLEELPEFRGFAFREVGSHA